MGILQSQYQVSIWKDVWQEGKFKEQRVCIIGTHDMDSQNKIIEPNLSRNVNGQKQFSFKLYSSYIDIISGEKVKNPFCDMLTNETKVKLWYQNKWYDFYVKNISKSLDNSLITYQLDDALVQELSKNGYDFAFDEYNNIGTAEELGSRALEHTDWHIESDTFVEMVEEHFVYVTIPKGTKITKIDKTNKGALPGEEITLSNDQVALAFYSSCTTKPTRFQFVYLPDNQAYVDIPTNDKQLIDTTDVQFYYDVDNIINDYSLKGTNYYLPNTWSLSTSQEEDVTLSLLYRGGRYGYSIKSQYLSKIDKYCNLYSANGVQYYGFLKSEYISPALATNFITNAELRDTSGWTGSYMGDDKKFTPSIVSEFGEFDTNGFVSVVDQLKTGVFELKESLSPYLRVDFPKREGNNYGYLINSGFYDNRNSLTSLEPGEDWTLYLEIRDENGNIKGSNMFDIGIYQIDYDPYKDCNELKLLTESEFFEGGVTLKFKDDIPFHTKEELANTNYKLIIAPNLSNPGTTFYISSAKLFKNYYKANGKLLELGELDTDGIINNQYCLFSKEDYDKATSMEDLHTTTIPECEFSHSIYHPQYTEGCQRVRSLEVQKSNYFNILQSIAETFECWVDLWVSGRDENGAIAEDSVKTVRFREYVGSPNYAPLRYGLNLSNMTRTFESKQIVTKLIVEPNVNELAKEGYCTISRAPNNPTGEDHIYDFQYFFYQKLLDQKEYEATMFYNTNPITEIKESGTDIEPGTPVNIQNYYNRIKALNLKLEPVNNQIKTLSQDISKLKASKVTEEKLKATAEEEIEDTMLSIYAITGTSPEDITLASWDKAECNIEGATDNEFNDNTKIAVSLTSSESVEISDINNPPTWNFNVTIVDSDFTIANQTDLTKTQEGSLWHFTSAYDGYSMGHRYVLATKIKSSSTLKKVEFKILPNEFSNTSLSINGNKSNDDGTLTLAEMKSGQEYKLEIACDHDLFDFTGNGNLGFSSSQNISCVPGSTEIKKSEFVLFSFMSREVFLTPEIICSKSDSDETLSFKPKISCTIPSKEYSGSGSYTLQIANLEDDTLISYLTKYATYLQQLKTSNKNLDDINGTLSQKENELTEAYDNQQKLISQKQELHRLFYSIYSRFILEGTWKNDEYIDDNKYYTDSLSVLYNSCYPQVAYDIKIISLQGLPEYEQFQYELGDTAYVEDADFFGTSDKIEVLITNITENLDDQSKTSITVQNFKNQFQDLFQKLTASVQQTNYQSGSYEKAVALAESDNELRFGFISEGLSTPDGSLSVAGQSSVTQDIEGITLTDEATQRKLKLMGSGILIGTNDPRTGVQVWNKVLSPDGISASALKTGTLHTSEVSIMNGNDPTFRWDKFGISAFDMAWTGNKDTKPDPHKFVRFDKYGIYGIKSSNADTNPINGTTWKPSSNAEIDQKATFALTWEGLKVTGNQGVEARLGKNNNNILAISKNGDSILTIDNDGNLSMKGKVVASEGNIAGWRIKEKNLVKYLPGKEELNKTLQLGEAFLQPGGTVGEYKIANHTQTNWALGIGPNFGITTGGELYASAGSFTGKIYAEEGGSIAGWAIRDTSLIGGQDKSNTSLVGLFTNYKGIPGEDGELIKSSIAVGNSASKNDWRILVGYDQKYHFGVDKEGILYAQDANIAGAIHMQNGGSIAGWTVNDSSIIKGTLGQDGFHMYSGYTTNNKNPSDKPFFGSTSSVTYWALGIGGKFGVTMDGKLYASSGTFTGTVNASEGHLGSSTQGWEITDNGIKYTGNAKGGAHYAKVDNIYYEYTVDYQNTRFTPTHLRLEVRVSKNKHEGAIADPETEEQIKKYYGISSFGRYEEKAIPWVNLLRNQ